MTGYGRAEADFENTTYIVELRSLNGKQLDIRLFVPSLLKPYEIDIRSIIAEKLMRGSIECTITIKQNGTFKAISLNTSLIKAYYTSIKNIADELSISTNDILGHLLKFPDVITQNRECISEAEWEIIQNVLSQAATILNAYREEEGKMLKADLLTRIQHIEEYEERNAILAPLRKEKMKENLLKLLEEQVGAENYDKNRLEQELIYYIEKFDMSEEQTRLKKHCDYFKEIIANKDIAKGKKLSFILQEIGREINTTGSKANDADIQKNVVQMKDELEKAKEQILNVL